MADADQSLPGLSAKLVKSEMGLSRPRKECNERMLGQRMTGRTNGQYAVEKGRKRKGRKREKGRLYFDQLDWAAMFVMVCTVDTRRRERIAWWTSCLRRHVILGRMILDKGVRKGDRSLGSTPIPLTSLVPAGEKGQNLGPAAAQ